MKLPGEDGASLRNCGPTGTRTGTGTGSCPPPSPPSRSGRALGPSSAPGCSASRPIGCPLPRAWAQLTAALTPIGRRARGAGSERPRPGPGAFGLRPPPCPDAPRRLPALWSWRRSGRRSAGRSRSWSAACSPPAAGWTCRTAASAPVRASGRSGPAVPAGVGARSRPHGLLRRSRRRAARWHHRSARFCNETRGKRSREARRTAPTPPGGVQAGHELPCEMRPPTSRWHG